MNERQRRIAVLISVLRLTAERTNHTGPYIQDIGIEDGLTVPGFDGWMKEWFEQDIGVVDRLSILMSYWFLCEGIQVMPPHDEPFVTMDALDDSETSKYIPSLHRFMFEGQNDTLRENFRFHLVEYGRGREARFRGALRTLIDNRERILREVDLLAPHIPAHPARITYEEIEAILNAQA